jgi:acetamidase/formamidase
MVDFLAATKGLDKLAAYQLTSVAGNVVITSSWTRRSVHVKMPKSIFR